MPINVSKQWEFERPLVIVSFPTQGLVGAITTSYLVPTLGMELVATMDSPLLPPVASVRNGRALAPIQFYATQKDCGPNGECAQLVVIRSDVTPDPTHADEIASEIMEWIEGIKPTLVLTLSGAKVPSKEPEVFAIQNIHGELDLSSVGATPYPDGSVGGMSAAFLTLGNNRGVSVVALMTGIREGIPDAAAAARLVEATDVLVPGIKMDARPLEAKARQLEAQIRASLETQHRSVERMRKNSVDMMYR